MKNSIFDYTDNYSVNKDVISIEIKKAKTNNPNISIVIPTYKRIDTLKEALDSAIKQEEYGDYDIIVLDNCPDRGDETETMIERDYTQIPNLAYYKNSKNLGMFGNWNRAIELCRGEYMLLLHDDDLLSPYYMRSIMPVLKTHDVDLLKTKQILWTQGAEDRPMFPDCKVEQIPQCLKGELGMIFNVFGDKWMPSGLLLRKSAALKSGGYNADYYPSSDYAFFAKFLADGFNAYYYNQPLFLYRYFINAYGKVETKIKYLDIDDKIKKEIGDKLSLPSWYIALVRKIHFKFMLRAVQAQKPGYEHEWNGKVFRHTSSLDTIAYMLLTKFDTLWWGIKGKQV